MSCYHPLVGIFDGEYTENGKKKFKIEGALDPFEVRQAHPGSVLIPCGRCIGCRLDYSRSWADRMMLELDSNDGKGIFLTLTYDNEHMTYCHYDQSGFPDAGTLVKKDCQDFMKRLRFYYPGRRIRFYLAGEYGDHTFRPHYHVILFGIGLDDIHDLHSHGVNELGQTYYISDHIASIWSNGFVLLSAVSWKTCAYVARYVTKKLGSQDDLRELLNQEPVFALMSRKPGIGKFYLMKHPDCLDFQTINLSNPEESIQIRLPKYFLKQLNNPGTEKLPNPLYDPDRFDKIVSERQEFASDKLFLELSKTDLSFLDYLEAKENEKLAKIKSLTRTL